MILQYLKGYAEEYLGEKQIKQLVPACFNDAQRQATKDAGRIAGLRSRTYVNEPTAAWLSHMVLIKLIRRKILVFDLGGGIRRICMNQETASFDVSTAGDNNHLEQG